MDFPLQSHPSVTWDNNSKLTRAQEADNNTLMELSDESMGGIFTNQYDHNDFE